MAISLLTIQSLSPLCSVYWKTDLQSWNIFPPNLKLKYSRWFADSSYMPEFERLLKYFKMSLIIEDYDRMIRIILLTTISCTISCPSFLPQFSIQCEKYSRQELWKHWLGDRLWIIEDYDRMIRIILLTTISCTHLDIVHSSQYV